MSFIIAFILFVSAIVGIILLSIGMRGKTHKIGYIVGIVALGIFSAAAMLYLALTLLFVSSIM